MQCVPGTLDVASCYSLYYRHWCPDQSPWGILLIIHGLGGHSGLFSNVVDVLLPRGYCVYAPDLPGNGRSPGVRGHIQQWEEFRQVVDSFLVLIRSDHPGIPCFLLGHSLGGAIALDYVLRIPGTVQGVILSAPTLGKIGVSPLKFVIAQLCSTLWPTFSLTTGIDLEAGARDPAVLARYENDPLRHQRGSSRLATEYLKTADWLQAHVQELQCPLLMLQGGSDRVVSPDVNRQVFEQIPLTDKEWREYPNSYHELFDDLDYAMVIADLADWLDRHTG
jgi:alpha-beta hydrolase superfamily lysophospholipase